MELVPMKKAKSEYAIQTVSNALRVLAAFRDEDEIGVAELSRRLGLHKNNVFRLLATLEEEGYIEQSESTERYRLGLASLELGQSFARSRTLLAQARPLLAELSAMSGESSHLGMIDADEVVHVDGRVSERLVVTRLRVGSRLPVHCTALGKVLLGCAPEQEWQRFDRGIPPERRLAARTRRTIDDPDKFFEHLRTVAGQGFALDLEECEDGLGCVAAPIRDATGRVIAAFSVSAPVFRATEEDLHVRIGPSVVAAAVRLSNELGWVH
jgi:DNA-binding IclR family transcriptional regulator